MGHKIWCSLFWLRLQIAITCSLLLLFAPWYMNGDIAKLSLNSTSTQTKAEVSLNSTFSSHPATRKSRLSQTLAQSYLSLAQHSSAQLVSYFPSCFISSSSGLQSTHCDHQLFPSSVFCSNSTNRFKRSDIWSSESLHFLFDFHSISVLKSLTCTVRLESFYSIIFLLEAVICRNHSGK